MAILPSLIIIILCISQKYITINAKYQESYVTFGNGVKSERNLPVCPDPHQACNIIYRRFWLSPKVVRLCKCADRSECPWNWISSDKHSVNVSSRIQLKFCSPVGDLPKCGRNEPALQTGMAKHTKTGVIKREAYVGCSCDTQTHYFNEIKTDLGESPGYTKRQQTYLCHKLPKCQENEICGHITYRKYETYKKCDCARKQVCIWKERKTYRVALPLYEGPVYRGYCLPLDY